MTEFCPRTISFIIPGAPGAPGVQVTAVENATGGIEFTVDVLDSSSITGDLRGLFFHLDALSKSKLDGLLISETGGGHFLTNYEINADHVIDLGNGNNMQGATNPFDVGINFGTAGIGKGDNINSPVHFTLSNTAGNLTLDDFAGLDFGARVTSTGVPSAKKAPSGSEKIFVDAPAAPDAHDDTVSIFEDGASGLTTPSHTPSGVLFNVLANDTDADNDTLIITELHGGEHGTMQIVDGADADNLPGDAILYTPTLDYAGPDSFEYCVSDGHGGQDSATVNVSITAVADVPNLTYEILAGSTAYETIVRVTATQTDADNSEFIDQITLSGIPATVSVSESVFNPADQPLSLVHDFVLTLPSVGNTSFDLGITATAQELSNSDQETNAISVPIAFENKENDYTPSFLATNQSIWGSGPAFTFTDNRFIGIDGGDSGSGGTGEAPHSDDLIGYSYDAHVKAGFQSDLTFNGGTITANLNYNLGVDTHYNKTTDTLLITSDKLLTGGDFTTVGPQGHYKLDFIFNYDIKAAVTYDIVVDSGSIIDIHPTFNSTTNIIDLDSSDLSVGFDFPDPFGSLSATLAWPNITTDANSSSPPPGEFSSDGASNNFFTLTLDVDQALADIILKGANPFDIPYNLVDIVSGNIELADLDLSGGLNFLQSFTMQEQPLSATLQFEDGSSQAFTFGSDLLLPNAKQIDLAGDNDGIVEFNLLLDSQASLHNDTDLGFNIGYNFDLLKISYDAGLLGDGTIGPVYNTGGTLPLGSVDVYDTTFGLNFADQTVGFFL
jgi:hypothetical protein